MVMAIDESLVKLETSEKGIPKNTGYAKHICLGLAYGLGN